MTSSHHLATEWLAVPYVALSVRQYVTTSRRFHEKREELEEEGKNPNRSKDLQILDAECAAWGSCLSNWLFSWMDQSGISLGMHRAILEAAVKEIARPLQFNPGPLEIRMHD